MAYLSVSAFAADFINLGKEIDKVNKSGADFLHIDVMDGHFVPLMGLGTTCVESISQIGKIPLDIHFMTENTRLFVPQYLKFGVESVVFHVESETGRERNELLELLRRSGIRCGLAISPQTPVSAATPYLDRIDEVLLMSTMPGCTDSQFRQDTFRRIREISALVRSRSPQVTVSVDGGIDSELALQCIANGADKIIMGRAFFKSLSPERIADKIHGAGQEK